MIDMEKFTEKQKRAARRASKALKELSNDGLYLIYHASSGTIYAVDEDGYQDPHNSDRLQCGQIDDGGDW